MPKFYGGKWGSWLLNLSQVFMHIAWNVWRHFNRRTVVPTSQLVGQIVHFSFPCAQFTYFREFSSIFTGLGKCGRWLICNGIKGRIKEMSSSDEIKASSAPLIVLSESESESTKKKRCLHASCIRVADRFIVAWAAITSILYILLR